jgi:hypothetical protein
VAPAASVTVAAPWRSSAIEAGQQPALDRLAHQKAGRDQEAEHHRHKARERREPAFAAVQRDRRRDAAVLQRRLIALPAAAIAFERDQRGDQRQQRQRDLRGARQAAAVEPGGEDRQRQRLDAEIFAGADIVERLQQRQRHADRQRRPRQWQRDVAHQAPRRCAGGACRVDEDGALRLEHRAGRQIHIGIEHEAYDQHGAAERTDRRKPVFIGGAPAEQAAQRRLHGAGGVQDVHVDVSGDVGRDRERQRQQPQQRVAAGKAERGHQPGAAGAGDCRHGGDAGEQQRGLHRRRRQDIGDEMRPDIGVADGGDARHAQQRQHDHCRGCERDQRCRHRQPMQAARRNGPAQGETVGR